jgi:hypothetical protein
MAESALLKAVLQRLQWAENQRQLYYERLNSGKMFAIYKDKHDNEHERAVNLCRQGTADVIVIQKDGDRCIVTFLETKANGNRQTKDQREFETKVKQHGCRYVIVRKLDDLAVLGLSLE